MLGKSMNSMTSLLVALILSMGICHTGQANNTEFASSLDEERLYNFRHFAGQNSTFVGWIKFVVIKKGTTNQIIYFDSNKWAYHADFTKDRLAQFKSHSKEEINNIALDSKNTDLTFGSISFLNSITESKKGALLQVLTNTAVPAKFFTPYLTKASATTPKSIVKRLRLLPDPNQRQYFIDNPDEFKKEGISIYILSRGKKHETYNPAWTVGTLIKLKNKDLDAAIANGTITKDKILLLDELPRELPPVRGLSSTLPLRLSAI